MKVTQKDIARHLGLSHVAVSYALSGSKEVGEKTRNLVLETAQKLGYRTNAAAIATVTGKFQNIALLQDHGSKKYRSELSAPMLIAMEEALAEKNFNLTISQFSEDAFDDMLQQPKVLRQQLCDGMILNCHFASLRDSQRLLELCHIPAIWVNNKLDADCVYVDEFDAGVKLAKELIRRGHRQIAYLDQCLGVAEKEQHYSRPDRYEGVKSICSKMNIPLTLCKNRNYNLDHPQIMQNRTTAIISYSVELLFPVLFALGNAGLKIPQDVELAAFGSHTPYPGVPFLKAGVYPEEVGKKAIAMLFDKIAKPNEVFKPNALKVTAVVEENSAAEEV